MQKQTDNQRILAFQDGITGGVVASLVVLGVAGALVFFSPVGERLFDESPTVNNVSVTGVDVADVVERVNPAVVSIIITQEVAVVEEYYEDPFGGLGGFQFRIPRYRENGTESREVGGGSGFLISDDGYIISNAHVVNVESATFAVYLDDGTSYPAEVIAADAILDIALLKIDGTDLPFLAFGDSDALRLGEGVIAIGNALGEFRNTVSTGVVSGLGRDIIARSGRGASEELENVIQTDAAINPGNSGGPLLNFGGEVIGVNVAVAIGSENIGFAIPSNVVAAVVDDMKTLGKVVRPFIGVRYHLLNPIIAEENDLPVDYGALIVGDEANPGVLADSPAAEAGLREGDIILEMNGQRINETNTLADAVRDREVGDTVLLRILREGEEVEVDVTLGEM